MTTKAIGTVQEDNERTRVTKWFFSPGAETGTHRHEYDYVVVPLSTGTLKIIDHNNQEITSELTAEVSYFRRAGVEHNVINASKKDFSFIEIEFK